MTISLGKAISCIKEDEKWVSKCIIGGIIYIVIPFIVGFIAGLLEFAGKSIIGNAIMHAVTILTAIYVTGFVFTSMNRVINSSEPFKMAEWNEKNLMLAGLKVIFAIIGWSILFMLVFGLGFLIVVGVFAAIIGFISSLICTSMNLGVEIAQIFTTILCLVVGLVFGLYVAQFVNNAYACYLKTLKFGDFVSFKKHFRMIRENKHANWTLVGKNVLYSLAAVLVIIALSVSVVGVLAIPFVSFVCYFIAYNLISQYAKEIEIDKYLEN